MESIIKHTRLSILIAYISISATFLFIQTDGRSYPKLLQPESTIDESVKKLKAINHLGIDHKPLDSFNLEPSDVSSPFTLPPFDSLSPLPLPGNVPLPPFCVNRPFTPQTPPKTPHSEPPPPPPPPPTPPPPPSSTTSTGPKSPPHSPPPSTPGYVSSPAPSPTLSPHPPKPSQSPPKHGPSPPVVYPPPSGLSPPSHKKPQFAIWCVAKPTVPDPIIQEAMDYACGSGADCKSIQPNGSCFQPDTLAAHASYAFNSYWQNTKAGGGTCDFGGTAMLVTVDPSSGKCHFIYN